MSPLTCNPGRPHSEQLVAGLHAVQLVLTDALVAGDRSLEELAASAPRAARADWNRVVAIARAAVDDVADPLEAWGEVGLLRALGRLARATGPGWIQAVQSAESSMRQDCPQANEVATVRAGLSLETRGYEAAARVY